MTLGEFNDRHWRNPNASDGDGDDDDEDGGHHDGRKDAADAGRVCATCRQSTAGVCRAAAADWLPFCVPAPASILAKFYATNSAAEVKSELNFRPGPKQRALDGWLSARHTPRAAPVAKVTSLTFLLIGRIHRRTSDGIGTEN